ncbi:cortistatin-like [Tachyglossus aculeatus]|uniref:cortistatin-like n=1 Tax=Tachyglossus aculeatus TaxID=9261 RepID=UPI0018F707F6|nr:cortistatin-like [Tachyglossus aculeatus]
MYQTTFSVQPPLALSLLLLVSWAVATATALPLEDSLTSKESKHLQEVAEVKTNSLLTLLSALYDWTAPGKEMPPLRDEAVALTDRQERALLNQSPLRERGPCKNFFWKTFSSC